MCYGAYWPDDRSYSRPDVGQEIAQLPTLIETQSHVSLSAAAISHLFSHIALLESEVNMMKGLLWLSRQPLLSPSPTITEFTWASTTEEDDWQEY